MCNSAVQGRAAVVSTHQQDNIDAFTNRFDCYVSAVIGLVCWFISSFVA